MTAPALEVRGLTRRFGKTVALDALDLTVGRGEVVGLVGPNGAGKTTLLHVAAGILRPDAGHVLVCGLEQHPDVAESRRRLAFVGAAPDLHSALTVAEHLSLACEMYETPDGDGRAAGILARLGLEQHRDTRVEKLSLGFAQRTALARAFVHAPDLYLLDEALNGLDPASRRAVAEEIASEAARGASVLLASHQVELLSRLVTRLVVLRSGRVAWQGSASEAGATPEEIALRIVAETGEAEPPA